MSTTMAKNETIQRKWYVIDAAGKSLGRTAALAASLLKGKHKVDYTPNDIRGMLSAEQVGETELFKVYVSNPDPEMAARIANAIAEVIPTAIADIVEGSSTKIIDYAKVAEHRYTPSYTKNTILSGMIGGFLAVAIITIQFLLDVRIKEAEDLMSQYDYPILGQIPNFEQINTKRSGKNGYGYGYETAKVTEKKE